MKPINPNNKRTDLQVLKRYYDGEIGDEDLTAHLMEKKEILESIYSKTINRMPPFRIREQIRKKYKVSYSHFYNLRKEASILLSDAHKTAKEIKRQISENMALRTYKRADKVGNFKEMNAANKNYTLASGLNIEDPEMPDFEKMKSNVILIALPENQIAALELLLQGGVANLNSMPITAEIEYEELDENNSDEG